MIRTARGTALVAALAAAACATSSPPEAPPPDADPMTRVEACEPLPDRFDRPVSGAVVSVTADGDGARIVVDRGRLHGLTLCQLASVCTPPVRGVVVGLSDHRVELRFPAPHQAFAACRRAVISRGPDAAP